MNIEDIKVGEIYNTRMKVTAKSENRFVCQPLLCGGNMSDFAPTFFNFAEVEVFHKPYLVPETAPKYDPCRKFRKGDKVRVVKYKGRCKKSHNLRVGDILSIADDEANDDTFIAKCERNNTYFYLDPAYLELVLPVEEQERYVVIHNKYEKYFEVCWKDDDEPDGRTGRTRCRVTYWYHQPPMTYTEEQAKAAAEAERDRLNAEYRKERKNV